MGAVELQVFVSLVVILGAAFVALICDFLKGNNEQLRETNIELKVRHDERSKREEIVERAHRQTIEAVTEIQKIIATRPVAPEYVAPAPSLVAKETAAPVEQTSPAIDAREQARQLEVERVERERAEKELARQQRREERAAPEPVAAPPSKPYHFAPLMALAAPDPLAPAEGVSSLEPVTMLSAEPFAPHQSSATLEAAVIPGLEESLQPIELRSMAPAAPLMQPSSAEAITPSASGLVRLESVPSDYIEFEIVPPSRAPEFTLHSETAAPEQIDPTQEALPQPLELRPVTIQVKLAPVVAQTLQPVHGNVIPISLRASAIPAEAAPRAADSEERLATPPASYESAMAVGPAVNLTPEPDVQLPGARIAISEGLPEAAFELVAAPQLAETQLQVQTVSMAPSAAEMIPGAPAAEWTNPEEVAAATLRLGTLPLRELTLAVSEQLQPISSNPLAQAAVSTSPVLAMIEVDEAPVLPAGTSEIERPAFQIAEEPVVVKIRVLTEEEIAAAAQTAMPAPATMEASQAVVAEPLATSGEPEAPTPLALLAEPVPAISPQLDPAPAPLLQVAELRTTELQPETAQVEASVPQAVFTPDIEPACAPEMPEEITAEQTIEPEVTVAEAPVLQESIFPLSGRANISEPAGIAIELPEPILPSTPVADIRSNVIEMPMPAVAEKPAQRELAIPGGFHEATTLARLLQEEDPFHGLAIAISVVDYVRVMAEQGKPAIEQLMASVTRLVMSLTGEQDFACRIAEDEFVLLYPKETGAAAKRRTQTISERLWDFQLRSLGTVSVIFSWGAGESQGQSVLQAVETARDQMLETRRNRRAFSSGTGRFRSRIANS
jgi:GGDEF domain-containing protein